MRPFNEDDLIAYHLGELPARRARQLEETLQVHSALAAESAAIAATLQAYRGHTPADLAAGAADRTWHALQAKMRPLPMPKTRTLPRWRFPALAGAAALAAAGVVAYVATRSNPSHSSALPVTRAGTTSAEETSAAATSTEAAQMEEQRAYHRGTGRLVLLGNVNVPSVAESLRFGRDTSPLDVRPYMPSTRSDGGTVLSVEKRDEALLQSAAGTAAQTDAIPAPALPARATAADATNAATGGQGGAARSKRHPRGASETDLTLSIGGTFTATRKTGEASTSGLDATRGASRAVIAMASFHQQFRPALGYRVALSYMRPDFSYTDTTYGATSYINGSIFELAGTYVVQGRRRARVTPSAEVGAGIMSIHATKEYGSTSANARVAGIIGVGADVAVTDKLSVRTAYRGQIYQGPDFNQVSFPYSIPTNGILLYSNEPSLGITWHFNRKNP